jgi:hypothetical protein
MKRKCKIWAGAAVLAVGCVWWCLRATASADGGALQNAANAQTVQATQAIQMWKPSAAEIESRTDKLLGNQHRDDDALDEYERVEHQVERTGGASPRLVADKFFRVVPTGSGNMKILLRDSGKDVDPAAYHQQLLAWRDVLELMMKPDDTRAKTAAAKAQKKKSDRMDLVDAARHAYIQTWLAPEMVNGHLCDVIDLTPDPTFHPKNILQAAMRALTAKIWVDRNEIQLARAEAHVTSDISVGAGILGKLYKGGVFSMEQVEVAPGIWQPLHYRFDYTARKFVIMVDEHQAIDVSEYRHDGPPKEAIVLVQKELASGERFTLGQ